MARIHMKGRTLQIVEEMGPLWEYEIAAQLIKEYGLKDNGPNKGKVRMWLIELAANALIKSIEDAVDDGTHFGEDKLLCRYEITEFGRGRMKSTGLL